MIKKHLFLLFLMVFCACNKPNPNPETLDPIYNDLLSKKAAAESAVAAEQKVLDEQKAEIAKAVPQTGQIKFAQKRYFESQERLVKLNQQAKYYEIKAESRRVEAKIAYLKAFHKKEEWPDPKEYALYKEQLKASERIGPWSVKARMNEFAPKPKAGGTGEAPPSGH